MTISEVCEKLKMSQDTLRYYEKIGLIPKILKNSGGFREYTEADCARIAAIKWMRAVGMSIGTATDYINMARNGSDTVAPRKKLLLELRDRLIERIDELKAIQRFLEKKIAEYETDGASEEEILFHQDFTPLL